MKPSQLIFAIALGLLIGVVVFSAVRDKPSPGQAPGQVEEGTTPTPTEPSEPVSDLEPESLSASDLVTIPGGRFLTGSAKAQVDVPAFRIHRHEVTNGQYEAFIRECTPQKSCGSNDLPNYWEDQSYMESRRDHPVVFVSWEEASAFCRWEGGRLPSALEWEKAARGTDGRSFPNGNSFDPDDINLLGDARRAERDRAPRKIPTWGTMDERYARDRSPYGILAMAGNVSEWTATASEEETGLRLAAGGSWDSWDFDDGSVHNLLPKDPMDRSSSLGFRCAFSERFLNRDVLRVAAEPDTPPMLTRDESGYGGFDWEIARVIARRLGVKRVEIIPGKYSELPARLISGRADVIISGYTADDSIAGVAWSESYFDYGLCLIVRKGSGIRSIADLQGKVIGIFNDPAAESDVQALIKGYKRLEKYEDGYFDLLAQGQLDAFLYDFPYTQEEIKPYGDQLEIVQYNLTESTYNVGVRLGETSLLKMVNAAIRELRGSEEYRQIVRNHLGGSEPPPITTIRAGQEIYRVQQGDTLSSIARARLNRTSGWTEIWELNKERIADPNLIEVGWELVIPRS